MRSAAAGRGPDTLAADVGSPEPGEHHEQQMRCDRGGGRHLRSVAAVNSYYVLRQVAGSREASKAKGRGLTPESQLLVYLRLDL